VKLLVVIYETPYLPDGYTVTSSVNIQLSIRNCFVNLRRILITIYDHIEV